MVLSMWVTNPITPFSQPSPPCPGSNTLLWPGPGSVGSSPHCQAHTCLSHSSHARVVGGWHNCNRIQVSHLAVSVGSVEVDERSSILCLVPPWGASNTHAGCCPCAGGRRSESCSERHWPGLACSTSPAEPGYPSVTCRELRLYRGITYWPEHFLNIFLYDLDMKTVRDQYLYHQSFIIWNLIIISY